MRVSMSPDAMPVTACSWISQYTISLVPEDHDRVSQYAVLVIKVAPERWLVATEYGDIMWRDTDPAHASYRRRMDDSEWEALYTRPLNKAFQLAWDVAAICTVNGVSAQRLLDKEGEPNSDAVPDHPGAVVQEPDGEAETGQPTGPSYYGRHRPALDSRYCKGSD